MLEVFRADFITTARAKGQKESAVIWKHMFPNAVMPIITMVIGGLGRVVGGSAIIGAIFSIAKAIMGILPNPPAKLVGGEIMLDGESLTEKSEEEMLKVRGARSP